MGNCLSENQSKEQVCLICDDYVNNMRYLKCVSCKQAVHIKCLYKYSHTMNTCIKCKDGNLNIINVEEHKERIWSRSSILTSSIPSQSSKKKYKDIM
jgi:hypothetical protein